VRWKVEGWAVEAGDQEQRVATEEAVLDGADDAAGPAHRLLGAVDQPVDDEALEDPVGEAADRQRRADDEKVDRLVEVPLAEEEVMHALEAGFECPRPLRIRDVEPVGDPDPGEGDDAADP